MSLINDALKRAAESQSQEQAQTRPGGPKGIENLPAPMTPVAARERPAWLPVVGIAFVIIALLGASGFFFAKWWKERKAWQPYAETPPDDDPATNKVARLTPPTVTNPPPVPVKTPSGTPPTATNPPVKTNIAVAVSPTPTNALPPDPVTPKTTNPVAVVVPPPKLPDPVVPPPAILPPPPVTPPTVATVETNLTPLVVPPVKPAPPVPTDNTKKGDDHTKVAAVEFPELKLQGIIRGKKKTTVIVNGKTLSLGDRIEGALLLKIEAESVTFEKGSMKRELFLLR